MKEDNIDNSLFSDLGDIAFHQTARGVQKQPTQKKIQVFDCNTCGLDKTCKSPKMPTTGEGKCSILVVAEAPGATEDDENRQLVGDAGKLFCDYLSRYNLDLDRDFWKENALACRPPDNATPTDTQLKCCRERLENVILEKKPRFIWLMGNSALRTFYKERQVGKVILGSWTRQIIPDMKYGCWVLPMYHPSALLRSRDRNFESFYSMNLTWAVSCLARQAPVFPDYWSMVNVLTEFNQVVSILKDVLRIKPKVFIFDYETSGLKAYYPGHKIFSASFYFEGNAYSFPFDYPDAWTAEQREIIAHLWRQIMLDPDIGKVSHNLVFEYSWTKHLLECDVKNWVCCTMNNVHILDSRSGLTGLKSVAFRNFGVEGYDKAIDDYKKEKKGSYFNRVDEFPLIELLKYGGMDSLMEGLLFNEQEKVFQRHPSLASCRDFYTKSLFALYELEEAGICVDMPYFLAQKKALEKERETLLQAMQDSHEAAEFKRIKGRDCNFGKSQSGLTNDLKFLLLDIMKVIPDITKLDDRQLTAKKKTPKITESMLSLVEKDFTDNFVRSMKLKKILEAVNLYIKLASPDGKLHPGFTLHVVKTGRSSATQPNIQNIFKRDLWAKGIIRTGLIPSPGNYLLEVDYSALEFRGYAFYSHDPVMLDYVENDGDPHTDQAKDIFIYTDAEWAALDKSEWKPLRQFGKNGFVFPTLYGDYHKNCAIAIWEALTTTKKKDNRRLLLYQYVLDHLRMKGIRNGDEFIEHMKGVEDRFWHRFSKAQAWQDEKIREYQKRGYVDSFFGFRNFGFLKKNNICNSMVQGTCFHILLWALGRINEIRKAEGWKTKMIAEIHDAIVFDLYPPEAKHVMDVCRRVMCEETREAFAFIIVPLAVEFAFYKDNWNDEMKDKDQEIYLNFGDDWEDVIPEEDDEEEAV